ncbi:MAG: extracellular solute-binding protein [Pirellulales bacterium]|nr:extracellular solute-binding protein [Pirellulales bacterium]
MHRPFRLPPSAFRLPHVAYCLLSLLLCGCPQSARDRANEAKRLPYAGVKLKLLVVDDAGMARAIERLRGEWSAQSGSDFEVVQSGEQEFSAAESLSADAVICPSRQLALLAEKQLLAELPDKIQQGREWTEVFELPKLREASWGGKIYGLPFGSPVFTIYYRADLLKKLHRTPPKTWNEYQELAELLAAEKTSTPDSPWHGTLEPLAPGWAGLMLLARAAPYAKHRDNYSTWFDPQTMEPQIALPPLAVALVKLAEAAKTNSGVSLKCDPAAVRRAFWAGECGMAITWPTASERPISKGSEENAKSEASPGNSAKPSGGKYAEFEVGFVELPGSRQVYDVSKKSWEIRREEESPLVPFLGIAGRLGAVNAQSPAREAAFALLEWLSSGQNSPQICPASASTTPFEKSHLDKPQLWTEKEIAPAAAAQYAELTAATLNREIWLDFRLPGREEYLAALDEAVQAAVEDNPPSAEAIPKAREKLAKAAEKWRKTTEKCGLDRQKSAYLHSLGLE